MNKYWIRFSKTKILCKTNNEVYDIVGFGAEVLFYAEEGAGPHNKRAIPYAFIDNFDLQRKIEMAEILYD